MFDNVLWNISLGYFNSNSLNKWKKKQYVYYIIIFLSIVKQINIFLYSRRCGARLLALMTIRVEFDLQPLVGKKWHVGVWLGSDTTWKKKNERGEQGLTIYFYERQVAMYRKFT